MVLPIYRNHLLGPFPALFLYDDFIPYAFKAKNLSVTFSYDLNWGDHVSLICRKVYGALARFRRLPDVTPFRHSDVTCCCAFDSFFIYCDCVYFALDSYSLRKLTVAFNACVRYVYRRSLFDHISDVYSILGCSLLTYMEFRLACFMFFLVTGVTGGRPRNLYDSLVFSRSERTLRKKSPTQSTEYMAGSVLARGIQAWNSLPVSARSSSSLQGFRRIVRDFLGISY
jgi:hypothetical protein